MRPHAIPVASIIPRPAQAPSEFLTEGGHVGPLADLRSDSLRWLGVVESDEG